jgi:hypothetical protein
MKLTNEHVSIIGKTRSGKSVFGLHLLQKYYDAGWKIVIIDIADTWSHFATVKEQSTIEKPHLYAGSLSRTRSRAVEYYVPSGMHDPVLASLYIQALRERNIVLYHDEIVGIASASAPIPEMDRVLSQGRKKYCIGIFCSQRPKNIPRMILTQSQYICCFSLTDAEDIDVMSKRLHSKLSPDSWEVPHSYYEYDEAHMKHARYHAPLPESEKRRVEVL